MKERKQEGGSRGSTEEGKRGPRKKDGMKERKH
jgi:hypothetical protein